MHLNLPGAQTNPSRFVFLQVATDPRFGGFILAAIVVNSALMAIEDYEDPGKIDGNPNIRNQIVSKSSPCLTRCPFAEASVVPNVP